MAQPRKHTRWISTSLAALAVGAALAAAFWPRATLVDFGAVTSGPMVVTIDEEGRTQVSEPYVVSTPVAGQLQRVTVNPGDPVERGKTVVAQMRPTNPSALDVRTREQAMAAVTAAEAALRVAKADLNAAIANRDLAESELARAQQLAASELTSPAALDRANQTFRVADAGVDTAEAAISMREADLANARATLIGFDDIALSAAIGAGASDDIPLRSPADGRILRIIQQSETTLPAGAPIMEIGDIEGQLEVVVDLISSDAVQVKVGDRVIVENWGGRADLAAEVIRIDPFGVTKYSALGVEEQRVPVTIAFTGDPAERSALGHGYRVETRIVTWETDSATIVPSGALFRRDGGWAVFTAEDGRARLRPITVGHDNGIEAEVLEGLTPGEEVILYPSAAIVDGARVAPRTAE